MLPALSVAAIATLLGVALAMLPAASARLLGPIRTFALTASLAVVLVHLVPEGFAELGAVALLAFGIGALVPIGLEALLARVWRRPASSGQRSRVGLEAGYAGLLVHKLGDGIGLGAYGGPLGQGGPQLDVMIALAAHTVPVVAVVVLAFQSTRGLRAGLWRAAGIALAIMLGVLIAGLVPPALVRATSSWVAAGVSGLLLHVVMHDLGSYPPRSASERSIDIVAALVGVAVPLLGSFGGHEHHEVGVASQLAASFARSFVYLSLDAAPVLLVGLFAGALIQSVGSRIPEGWLRSGSALLDALRGAVVAAPMPLEACRVLPVSAGLARRAGPGFVVAFLIATPVLGVETFTLGVRFLGWPLSLVRLAGALSIAIVAGLVVARAARLPPAPDAAEPEPPSVSGGWLRRTLVAFDGLLDHVGVWMVIGLVCAAVVEALVPTQAFAELERPLLELCVMTLIAVPSYLSAPAATPLAAVLIAKGLSPGAVLVGLMLGPATNLAALAFVKKTFGIRATLLALAALVSVSWLLALATNRFLPSVDAHAHVAVTHETHGALTLASGALLAALLLRNIWLAGARLWLASLGSAGAGHTHDHEHGHPTA